MPTASEEQRARWGIDDAPVVKFLEDRGYVNHPDWTWTAPDNHQPTEEELSAIDFLIDEWDYGGLRAASA